MVTYVAESAASAPPPRGLPFALPAARASNAASYVPPALVGDGGSDMLEEDTQPAYAAPASSASSLSAASSGDEDGPSLEMLEAQMGGEISSRDGAMAGTASKRRAGRREGDDDEGAGAPLPELDALRARLPAEVRETLEELFRAQFVAVKKLPKKAFGPASAKAPPDAA